MKTALLYNGDKPEARLAASQLSEKGYRILSVKAEDMTEEAWKEQEEHALDLLVLCPDTDFGQQDNAAGTGRDYDALAAFIADRIYDIHACIQRCIPMLEKGEDKRIVILTRACSSINWCRDTADFAGHMILTGVNMQAKLLFNRLHPQGFTVRCYAGADGNSGRYADGDAACSTIPKNVTETTRAGGIGPGEYALLDFCYDAGEPAVHSDENRLVMRDRFYREIAW